MALLESTLFGFLPNVGLPEMIVIMVIGVLLFGRNLPDVGRSLGRSIVEFKKAFNGIEDDINDSARKAESSRKEDRSQVDSPRFEMPGERGRGNDRP